MNVPEVRCRVVVYSNRYIKVAYGWRLYYGYILSSVYLAPEVVYFESKLTYVTCLTHHCYLRVRAVNDERLCTSFGYMWAMMSFTLTLVLWFYFYTGPLCSPADEVLSSVSQTMLEQTTSSSDWLSQWNCQIRVNPSCSNRATVHSFTIWYKLCRGVIK